MGCFLLIRHCKLSIFFPFKIPVCLRIKPWVSPLAYGLDNRGGTFLVFFNTYKHTICRTHIIVHTMIKEPRSWQDSMILFRVLLHTTLCLNRPPFLYLTHGKRNGSIKAYYGRGEPRITTRIPYKHQVPAETIGGSGSVGSLLCLWNV